ncbi:MAG: hypothetical protein KDH94_06790 [Coxiellaceae bacterium]|nr:hypothetical protein [Coxiellaceae bacterium]
MPIHVMSFQLGVSPEGSSLLEFRCCVFETSESISQRLDRVAKNLKEQSKITIDITNAEKGIFQMPLSQSGISDEKLVDSLLNELTSREGYREQLKDGMMRLLKNRKCRTSPKRQRFTPIASPNLFQRQQLEKPILTDQGACSALTSDTTSGLTN